VDTDPFELTEEEEESEEATESTMYCETTISEDEEKIPVEKQPTFLVFGSALILLFATCVVCGSAFVSIKQHVMESFISIKQACSQCNKYICLGKSVIHTKHFSWESFDVFYFSALWLLTSQGTQSIQDPSLCYNK